MEHISRTTREGKNQSPFDGFGLLTSRILTLRGLNVGGNTKQPSKPPIYSHIREGFLDGGDEVSFVGRPFSIQDADQHLSRIKGYGYNVIRFLITWEAIEHAGP